VSLYCETLIISLHSIANTFEFVDPETHPTMHKISAVHGEVQWAKYLHDMNKERKLSEGEVANTGVSLSGGSINRLNSLQEWIEAQSSVKVSKYYWVGTSILSMSPAQVFQSQLLEMNPDAPDIFETQEEIDSFDADFWRFLMASFSVEELSELVDKGTSNGYPLRFQILVLPKDSVYKIHAHPNIELIIGMVGKMMEAKLTDYYHSKNVLERKSVSANPPSDNEVRDMMDHFEHCMVIDDEDGRSLFVDRVCTRQGKCCANQIGSVHQSYSPKDSGTMVFVLWSGCHANVNKSNIKTRGMDIVRNV
jgi:hypothetical protein